MNNSRKYATDEILETMFIPSAIAFRKNPPLSIQKCVVWFETEYSGGARISLRLSTILNLPDMVRHITIECVAFQETNQMHSYQEINYRLNIETHGDV